MDAEFFVPIKIERKRIVRGAERESETMLGDYKEVAGVYFAHSYESGAKGSANRSKTVFDRIEANAPLDDSESSTAGAGRGGEGRHAMRRVLCLAAPLLFAAAVSASAQTPAASRPVQVDSETISGLGARNIGSAAMSGRVAALDAVREGERLTIFVGAASGGVWKSVNGGTTYKPVFDKQPVQSIGAVTIDPKNPKVVWVGTGESWTRNSVSIGDGIYKSVDGGESWTNLGLGETERIVRILVDPTATDTVYACAPGKLWSDSEARGVYKTVDGGKSWTKVLAGSNLSTGCSMISMDSKDSKTVYAGMWDFRRKGWTFRSGGDGPDAPSGSGFFKISRRRQDLDRPLRDGQGPAPKTLGPGGRDGRALEARDASTLSSRQRFPTTVSTARTTAARHGRRSTEAR